MSSTAVRSTGRRWPAMRGQLHTAPVIYGDNAFIYLCNYFLPISLRETILRGTILELIIFLNLCVNFFPFYRYFVYFKRSFVKREDGRFIGYPSIDFYPDVYPLTYSIAEAYVQPNKFSMIREIDILCTLRGSKLMTTRQRVSDWVKDYGATRKVENIVTQQVLHQPLPLPPPPFRTFHLFYWAFNVYYLHRAR